MTISEIWKSYNRDLHLFIISKVKDLTIADDLLQETFIKIHTKLNTLQDEAKIKPWIFTIARNTVMDYFRTHKHIIPLGEIENFDNEQEDILLDHSIEDCLRNIMIQLPKKYREPLFLHDIKGMKQADISKQLQLPLSTIKSQIQRGRKQITQGFIDCCGFELNKKGQLIGEVKEKEDCKICN